MDLLSADETLKYLIDIMVLNLQEISEEQAVTPAQSEFGDGLKTACVECLETIQLWKGAKESGLDWDVEARFPV